MNITWKKSPNFDSGRNWQRVKKIVIHWVGLGNADSAATYFSTTASGVSAHYVVGDDVIYQCVLEKDTAWHAGNLDVNRESIGIEHEANLTTKATDNVYKYSSGLIADICERYDIPIDREHIIGHKEVKATQCPGTIDIDRLISLAKGEEDNSDELEECLTEKLRYKGERNACKETLKKEREEHGKEVRAKEEIIKAQKELISGFKSKALSDDETIRTITKERNTWKTSQETVEKAFKEHKEACKLEIKGLNDSLAVAEQKIKDLSFWDYLRIKLGG